MTPLARTAPAALLFSTVLAAPATLAETTHEGSAGTKVTATAVAEFNEPWSMTFLPDGRLLVTEKPGALHIVTQEGEKLEVAGVPDVAFGGQGGLGDVVLAPDFDETGRILISYAEAGTGGMRGAAVAQARLDPDAQEPALEDLEVIWRQEPKVSGSGHYGHRLAFSPEGAHLFISSGERQKQTPAQEMGSNLGKLIRLNADGSVPNDNPYQDEGELARSFWSIGHRNPLGLAFDGEGRLWMHEMGPRGGDELNLIEAGSNYGWPAVSFGDNYSGAGIPDPAAGDGFEMPEEHWTPVISPAGLVLYSGEMFPEWQGDALIGGLSSRALVRVGLGEQPDGTRASEEERFSMGARIREVEQGPGGAVWLLEDASGGRLLRLTPQGG